MNLTNHLVFEFSRKVTKSQKIKPINIWRLSDFARLSKHNLREIIFLSDIKEIIKEICSNYLIEATQHYPILVLMV